MLRRHTVLFIQALACLALLPALSSAWAQEDPPGRVGRLAELQGGVSWYDNEQGAWAPAERNRPLTTGDRLSTTANARAELRIGSTTLRLGPSSEMEVLRLDDERVAVQLHSGSLALRLRNREAADETEVLTGEARLLPQRAGHYRFDRIDDTTEAGVWRGELRVDNPNGLQIGANQRAVLTREPRGGLRAAWTGMPDDAFGNWVAREDQADERSASTRYVSPEMTGAEDLDRFGRWSTHPEFGAVWFPLEVRTGWEPYRHGRWAWVRPWGWTWIDEAPWGFAPFHYGRWVVWGGRWGWVPGAYVARPVYAPALVAWGGGNGVNVSVSIGSPPVRWVPLAPREVYRPYYRATPVYVERVNPRPHYGWRHDDDRRPSMVAPVVREVQRLQPAPQPAQPPVMQPPRPPEREMQRIPERRAPERVRERPPERPQPELQQRMPERQVERPPERPAERQPERQPERPPERAHQPDRPPPAREGAIGRAVERAREEPRAAPEQRPAPEQRQRRPEAKVEPRQEAGKPNRERGENQR